MRLWKRLLGTALCLCAAVCVMSVSASAAEHNSHPICGDTAKCTNPDHSGESHGGAVTWEAWNGTDEITYTDTDNTACVYLKDNATRSRALKVTDGKTLNLCLNGKKLSRSSTVIEVTGGATLNICNCQGSGIITPTQSTYAAIEVASSSNSTATLNLYSGEVSGSVFDSQFGQSIIKLGSSNTSGMAVFNMYGGKVQNSKSDNRCSAVFVTNRRACKINIYGGEVTCDQGDGINAWNSGDAPVLIAGGTVTGGNYALHVLGNLTLSGSPTIRHTGKSGVDIDITTSDATTQNNYIAVTGDFAPAEGTKISVDVPNNQLETGRIIAKPAAGATSLSGQAKHFVSAEEGYFVECADRTNLQLTACAITKQPTVNDYTVTANGGNKVTYQWYSVTKGDAPVTSKNATAKEFHSGWDEGDWSYNYYAEGVAPVTLPAFTLHMSQGDVLKLTNAMEVDSFSIAVSGGTPNALEVPSWGSDVSYTAPTDGEYTLKVTATPQEGNLRASFTATVTADMLGRALEGQVNTALNTSPLETGSYICQVTWENKTTRNSQAVRYTASHEHNWSDAWEYDTYSHWHVCSICQGKKDVSGHTYDQEVAKESYKASDATCVSPARYYMSCVCGAKGTDTFESGDKNPDKHSGVLGDWQSDENKHWKEYSCCHVHANEDNHHWDDGKITTAATCTATGVKTFTCSGCNRTKTEAIEALKHDWGEWRVTKAATTSAAGEETRTCTRDASHTETRAIPKLTPAPSGGGSSGGSSSTPAVTVPVSGSGDTVHVSASVSGSTAEVKEIKSAELDKIGTDSAVVIDLSGLNKGVTGVTLSTDTIDSICKTEADGVTIKLPNAELRVDRQTLAAVAGQAAGSSVQLVVEPDGKARSTMTAAQRSALDGMRNAAVLEAYFVSDGTRIRDFNGGEVELSIPYQASGAIRAWYLKEDGTREPVSVRYDKENARLLLRHFSHYVIEELDSSAAYTVCAKDDTCPLAAFGDLTATAWYHDGVHYCLENGLMQGVSGGKFLPDGSTTRAQLVTILWRLEGSPKTTGAVRFNDTPGGAWYTEAVRWAADCGVVKGYDNGCFGPNDAVTREQMAAILYRYAQHKGYDVSAGNDTNILSFADAMTVSEYAIPAMQWACGSGMVRGIAQKGGMLLAPRDTTTRAQTATLIMRFQSAFAKEL